MLILIILQSVQPQSFFYFISGALIFLFQGHPLDKVKGGDGLWSDDDDDVAYYKQQVGEAPEAGTFRHSKKPRFDKSKVCACVSCMSWVCVCVCKQKTK